MQYTPLLQVCWALHDKCAVSITAKATNIYSGTGLYHFLNHLL